MRTPSSRWPVLVLFAVAAFWSADLALLGAGAPDRLDDSWEYALVAQSLLEGHGFRTPVVHPPLWSLRDASGTVPVLVHGPLLPIVLMPWVAAWGATAVDGIAWLSALFATLAAWSTARLGVRMGSPASGVAAAALLTLSPLMVRSVHHDIALPLGAWLLAESLNALRREPRAALRAGVSLGLGVLVRPEFLYAVVVLAPLAGRAWWRFAAAAALVAAPWGLQGWIHAGAPFFNLSSYLAIGYWADRPGISVLRDFSLNPQIWPSVLRESLPDLPAKWLDFLPSAAKRVAFTPTGATGWLVVPGWIALLRERSTRDMAWAAAALALMPLGVMTLTLYDERYLVPFLPVFAMGAALGARQLSALLPMWLARPRAIAGALLLLVLPSTLPALHDGWRDGIEDRARLREERHALAEEVARRGAPALVFTDTPDFVAWTLDRPSVWMRLDEYNDLPEWDGLGAGPHASPDRPRRTGQDFTWFHAHEGRGPLLRP